MTQYSVHVLNDSVHVLNDIVHAAPLSATYGSKQKEKIFRPVINLNQQFLANQSNQKYVLLTCDQKLTTQCLNKNCHLFVLQLLLCLCDCCHSV